MPDHFASARPFFSRTKGRLDRTKRKDQHGPMTYLLVKAALSGLLIALGSEVARRFPGFGALIVSLPLVSILSMIWLWRDTGDVDRIAAHATGTLWFLAPSIPMFFTIPAMLRAGWGFWPTLLAGCALTVGLYAATLWIGPRLGLRL